MISSFKSNPNWGKANQGNWNGFSFHWRVLGEANKKPVLLLHGFGASSEHWRKNAYFLEHAGYRVYSLDLIGFGQSEQPSPKKIKKLDNKFWSEQVANFLEEINRQNNTKKTILIGNSLGALVALTTSTFYPNLVSAVIAAPLPDPALMKSISLRRPKWLKAIKNILIRLFFNILPLELLIPLIAKTKIIEIGLQFAYFRSIKSDIELKNIVKVPSQRKTAPRSLRAMCIGMSTRNDLFTAPFLLDTLSKNKPRLPFLLIWGRKDRLVPLLIGKKLINRYHWIKLFILENSGHCPHDESSYEFNQYILNWLKLNL